MSKDNNFYTYIYLDSRKAGRYTYENICFLYEPIYVGKGCGKRCDALMSHNKHCQNKINKITQASLNPIIIFLRKNVEESEAFDCEISYIKDIGRQDLKRGPLCNWTDGREGVANPSQETRRKKSEKFLGEKNPMFGRCLSEEHRQKIKQSNSNRECSEKTRQKIAQTKIGEKNPNFGKKLSQRIRQKMSKAQFGENNPRAKLTSEQVHQIHMLITLGYSNKDISKYFEISRNTISFIKTGRSWKSIYNIFNFAKGETL